MEHLSSIAPNKRDPLGELLEDLGDSPSICSLLGKVSLDFLFQISLETTFEIELCDTYVLLLEHFSSIAPNKRDPLRELLEDLGDSPSICSLLGKDALIYFRN